MVRESMLHMSMLLRAMGALLPPPLPFPPAPSCGPAAPAVAAGAAAAAGGSCRRRLFLGSSGCSDTFPPAPAPADAPATAVLGPTASP